MNDSAKKRGMGVGAWLLLALALLVFFAQAAAASTQKSASYDEQFHLIAGYAYLKTGELRLNTGHPPLLNVLSALPLLVMDDVQLPLEHRSWAEANFNQLSDVFLWQANDRPHEMLVLARLPLILLGILLVAVLFAWARAALGEWAGWAVLVLATFDPNLLANARLVTTDLGLAFFLTLSLWLFWRWQQDPSPARLLLVGVAVGLTMTSKFTGLLVWPGLVLILLLGNRGRRRPARLLLDLLGIAVVAYGVLWAVYGFEVGPVANSPVSLPILAPTYPAHLWDLFRVIEEEPKTAYLLGMISDRGWWYYFPVALAVKTPLPLLLLAGTGLVLLVQGRVWRRYAVFWVPPALFMAVAMTGRMTIGYRHILPAVPFLILLGGYAVARAAGWVTAHARPTARTATVVVIAGLLLWHAAGTLLRFPHQQAFFNEIAGGPTHGDRVLVDSNLDWGQDLIMLKKVMAEKGIDEVYLAYFGTGVPEAYGVRYKPLPSFMRFVGGAEVDAYNPYTPPPGWYAISATSLRLGLFYQNNDIYAYFRDKEPVARAGYSIRLYRVDYPPDVAVKRTTLLGTAVADVPRSAWVVPPATRIIVKWTAAPTTEIWPVDSNAVLPADMHPVGADFSGAFRLLGYTLPQDTVKPGASLTLTLYWEVGNGEVETPAPTTGPPLAAFVHFSGEDPAEIKAQYDGWETALTGLEPGDVIAHQVTLVLPGDLEPGTYYLRAGLYSPQSGQRLPLRGETADVVRLAPVLVAAEE